MNKIEFLKSEKDGLKIKDDIARFGKEGWESISEGDIQRLKWYGLFLRNPTPGFFMQRVATRIQRKLHPCISTPLILNPSERVSL
jgi:sulfite reductase beta subunit-like hemoprotein